MAPYTPESSLLSPGRIGQATWAGALAKRVRGFEANQIADLYHGAAKLIGINPDLALAQACEETGWFTSDRWLKQNNPCGLGITSDDVPGHVFVSPEQGILAHLDHLCCYAHTALSCPVPHEETPDFRHSFHDGNPALSHLQDNDRMWAAKPGYVGRILAIANALLPKETPSMVTIREAIIPKENVKSNRPGTKLQGGKPTFITIHETANTSAGANAEMHRRFSVGANGWGGGGHPATATDPEYEGVSFHYVVDDNEAIHLLPDDEIGYHAGDGLGPNSGGATSLGIETCVNSDGNFAKALANLAQLVALLMVRHRIPLANVVQHNKWSGKDCPHQLRAAGWAGLLAAIDGAFRALTTLPPPTSAVVTPAIDWDGDGAIIHTYEEVIARNSKGQVYIRSRHDGTMTPWQELTK